MAEKPTLGHWIAIGVLVFLQAMPVLAVALNGFATDWAGSVLPEGYSLKWLNQMLADPRFLTSVRHSLLISVGTLIISALATVPATLVAHCYFPALDRWLSALVILPYAVPGVVLAV